MMQFFEKINEISMRWFDSLTDRERRLLISCSLIIIALFLFLVLFLGTGKLSTYRSELKANKEILAQIVALESDYFKAKKRSDNARLAIMQNNVSLFTLIQGITTKLGLSVKDLNEQKRSLPKSNIVEVSVRLNLSKLSIDKVTSLIEAIETSEYAPLIKVTKLKISKRYDEPDLLDLLLTVSTWKTA
jgi:hypothetical protein